MKIPLRELLRKVPERPWGAVSAFINNEPNRALVSVRAWGGENIADLGEATENNLRRAALIAHVINWMPELLDALDFYAEEENWLEANRPAGIGTGTAAANDYGARALEALAKVSEVEVP